MRLPISVARLRDGFSRNLCSFRAYACRIIDASRASCKAEQLLRDPGSLDLCDKRNAHLLEWLRH